MGSFKPFYMHEFSDNSDITREFQIPSDTFDGAKVLLAYYYSGGYEGSAFVLYAFAGKIYEVNGSHCSCYGLEDQWRPEETSIDALEHRLTEGELGYVGYCDEAGYKRESLAVVDYLKGGSGLLEPKDYSRPASVPIKYSYSFSFSPLVQHGK